MAAPPLTPRRSSRLWDRVLYPAAGRYHDLLDEAERLLSNAHPSTRARGRASRCIHEALELSPRRPQAWRLQGRLLATTGAWGRAADAYDRARKLDPHYQPRNLGYAFAMATWRAGRYVRAAKALLALRRPQDPARLAAMLETNAAEAYLAAGHLQQAIQLYKRAIARDVRYAPPRWGLAVAYHRAERPSLAGRLAVVALQIDPQAKALLSGQALYLPAASRHYHLALMWQARGDRTRARAEWAAYLKAAPRSPWRSQARAALTRLSQAAPRPHAAGRRSRARAPRGRRAR